MIRPWSKTTTPEYYCGIRSNNPPPPLPFPSQAFETPVANRLRTRPQSWHGSNAPGSTNSSRDGGFVAPTSAMSARSTAGRNVADHMLFYSVCQATFYVMCFRGDELTKMDGVSKQVRRGSARVVYRAVLFREALLCVVLCERLEDDAGSSIGRCPARCQRFVFVHVVGAHKIVKMCFRAYSQRPGHDVCCFVVLEQVVCDTTVILMTRRLFGNVC